MRATVLGEARSSPADLDSGVERQLREAAAATSGKSLLVWAEHCTECAMPSCYSTCSLYTPRRDLKCRRLAAGLELRHSDTKLGGRLYLARATFRRWGKLEAQGSLTIHAPAAARILETADRVMSRLLSAPLLPFGIRRSGSFAWNRLKTWFLARTSSVRLPDALLVEVIGEAVSQSDIVLTVRNSEATTDKFFQARLTIARGYNRHVIPAADILKYFSPEKPFLVSIEPAGAPDGHAVTFGTLDFVSLNRALAASTAKTAQGTQSPVKCVVWDLDNTLWRGTLVEDGAEKLTIDPAVATLIAELDARGILNSIASKNARDGAETILRANGLWDYFLYPQINWNPKSGSIAAIAESLNVGRDSLVLIDDQRFEREEVKAAHPEVETIDVTELDMLLARPRFNVPRTAESAKRRLMYKQDETRQRAGQEQQSDFREFLRSCGIELTIADLAAENIERVFELTERTNQLNYVARRLSRADLETLLRREGDGCGLVLSVRDRYGDYGIVGFAILDLSRWNVESFFMSCRVQRRKVDHAFFDFLRRKALAAARTPLTIAYLPSKRNEPSRVVLEDEMGLSWAPTAADRRLFRVEKPIVDSDIVRVDDATSLKSIVSEPADAL